MPNTRNHKCQQIGISVLSLQKLNINIVVSTTKPIFAAHIFRLNPYEALLQSVVTEPFFFYCYG